ncbi:unnamed protein product [Phytophthora lilii]|uniref:Unnamed protein product n=1 Tax=Phytophthora lilii TaxID=2077276 RepID=A0A9W6U214_9STRA|nr:unnamed protein product [Phytophthora lilii]
MTRSPFENFLVDPWTYVGLSPFAAKLSGVIPNGVKEPSAVLSLNVLIPLLVSFVQVAANRTGCAADWVVAAVAAATAAARQEENTGQTHAVGSWFGGGGLWSKRNVGVFVRRIAVRRIAHVLLRQSLCRGGLCLHKASAPSGD